MRNILRVKEIPFLLSLVISIAGAVIVSIGNKMKQLPVLEYSLHVESDKTIVQIANISNTKFDKITLIIECDTDHAIYQLYNAVYKPPAMEASSNKLPFQSAPNEWEYQLGPLQPNNIVRVVFSAREHVNLYLRFMIHDKTALVTTPNLSTFIIKNETMLLVVLLGFLIAASIAFYIGMICQTGKHQKEGQ